jgi:hypothetical protein
VKRRNRKRIRCKVFKKKSSIRKLSNDRFQQMLMRGKTFYKTRDKNKEAADEI